jgi:cytoskeletal protein CcmA (bactofilin family)
MGANYTRQSTYTEGDIIQASDTNDEFDQLLAAFAASTGHTHDGTTGEGGPISTLAGHGITFGAGTAGTDIVITFDGETNDGVLKWMEDEDYFEFSDDILVASSEKLQFRDTALYINSSTDGQLDIVADTLVQVATAAFTVDASGDITLDAGGADVVLKDDGTTFGSLTNSSGELVIKSGSTPTAALTFSGANITAEGNLTVDGNLDVTGTFDLSDSNFTNAGNIQLDSISGDADTNTSITFSGSDVITVATGGTTSFTVDASQNILMNAAQKVQFRDTALTIHSSADGQLDINADTELEITAPTVDINASSEVNISNNLTVGGSTTLGATSFGDANITNVGSIALDTITNDGTDITLDSGGDIILDAAGNEVFFKSSGTSILEFKHDSGDAVFTVSTADKNFTIKGTDSSSAITALDIDMALAGKATFNGDVVVGGDLTITGDDLVMGTNTAGHLLIADGTNFNPTAVGDLSEISSVANDDVFIAVDTSGGGLKKITRSTIVSGLAVSGAAISNVVEDTTPQLGGSLDVNGQDIVSVSNGNITITPNGSGVLRIDGSNGIDMQSGAISIKNSGAESYIRFYCESSNAHYTQLQAAPHSAYSGNVTVVLPASADTLVGKATTDTLTNKTFGDNVSFGDNNITNVGDIALDSISADATDINIAVTDNSATAFTIKQGSDNYFVVDTGNSSESIAIGTGVSGTAITLGHSTSEVTVADNLTVTGDLTVSGTTTTVNSTTVNLNDHNIVLDSGNSTSAVINGAGITIEGGSGDDATFTYNTTGPKFELKLGSSHEDLQVDQLIAASLDISGDVDVDGTLEADAITVNGTALNTVIAGVTVTDATNAAHVLVTDNENTNEDNLITFVENATSSTGNVGLEMDGDLTYNPSTGNLTTTKVTANGGVVVDNITIDGTEIDLSSGDLTVDVAGDIILDAGGGDVKFAAAGTEILSVTNSSSDVIIKPIVDAKDIIFQQRDGTEVARVEDNGTFNVVTDKLAINGTAVTATAAELNLIDGGTSVGGSITLADDDGFIVNDGGTMKTIPASDVKTYAAGSAATKGFAIAMAIVFG